MQEFSQVGTSKEKDMVDSVGRLSAFLAIDKSVNPIVLL